MANGRSKYRFDTEILISAIEQRKLLWDTSSEDYKNRNLKGNAWAEVADILIEKFEDLDETQKQEASSSLLCSSSNGVLDLRKYVKNFFGSFLKFEYRVTNAPFMGLSRHNGFSQKFLKPFLFRFDNLLTHKATTTRCSGLCKYIFTTDQSHPCEDKIND